jgi:hypothetical protein
MMMTMMMIRGKGGQSTDQMYDGEKSGKNDRKS